MSRWVSAGADADAEPSADDDRWLKAQEIIEASKKPKADEGKQEGGKSLYEVLQANKAAKQDAFEEAARLKNQFRALDEDEVDFLDSVLESSRAKEEAVKQETEEQLETFRKHRAAAEQALVADNEAGTSVNAADASSWAMKKRKRRREKDNEMTTGTKLRRLSTTEHDALATKAADPRFVSKPKTPQQEIGSSPRGLDTVSQMKKKSGGLGLSAYSSDEDD